MKKATSKMPDIVIYVEGGGPSSEGRAQLRQGFDELLRVQKEKARRRRFGWRLLFKGGRSETYEEFKKALKRETNAIVVLLVDAEGPVHGMQPAERVAYLNTRDSWDLSMSSGERVHLMVQSMEAWIVADPDALESYYGQHFLRKALPSRQNLHDEPKTQLTDALKRATKNTKKGEYEKIEHACKLLTRIDPGKVASRCPSFVIFTQWLEQTIEAT